jgi:hypothetical protein
LKDNRLGPSLNVARGESPTLRNGDSLKVILRVSEYGDFFPNVGCLAIMDDSSVSLFFCSGLSYISAMTSLTYYVFYTYAEKTLSFEKLL